ncbi:hypothetical protein [Rhizobium rhizogenes]|jgi:hypothetical protein|uniref:hypothetical protein n=1 Tax=Rhizobium rhizogenes TaxID=359 RepID=UPI0022C68896|nr:hypothetical protein [Rhizobium rhizogenes]MCZ7463978.1 hypothetical protein [Rhizobium rhizogenes]
MRNSPDGFDGRYVSGSVIAMVVASISGLLVGVLVRGDFAAAAFVITTAVVFSIAGWWARGLQP